MGLKHSSTKHRKIIIGGLAKIYGQQEAQAGNFGGHPRLVEVHRYSWLHKETLSQTTSTQSWGIMPGRVIYGDWL